MNEGSRGGRRWKLTRRGFLKAVAAGIGASGLLGAEDALGIRLSPANQLSGVRVAEAADPPESTEEKERREWVEQLNRELRPYKTDIPREITGTKVFHPVFYERIPAVQLARYLPPEEKMKAILRLMGIETKSEIDPNETANESPEIQKEIQRLTDLHDRLIQYRYKLEAEGKVDAALAYDRNVVEPVRQERIWATAVPRFTHRTFKEEPKEYWPCDPTSTGVMHCLGFPDWDRIDTNEKPSPWGRYIGAGETHVWLGKHHREYGFEDVTNQTYDQLVELVRSGKVIYGSTKGHTFVLWGLTYPPTGETLLTLTQSGDFKCSAMFVSRDQYHTARRWNSNIEPNLDLKLYAATPPEFKPPEEYPDGSYYMKQRFIGECGPVCLAMFCGKYLGWTEIDRWTMVDLWNRLMAIVDGGGEPAGKYATIKELTNGFNQIGSKYNLKPVDRADMNFWGVWSTWEKYGERLMIARINGEWDGSKGLNHFIVIREVDRNTWAEGSNRVGEAVVFDPLNTLGKFLPPGAKPYSNGPIRVSADALEKAMQGPDRKWGELLVLEERVPA